MNPTARPSHLEGGRFDSVDGSDSYTYVGRSPQAAVAESLCRDLPWEGVARLVPHARIRQRVLSALETTAPLSVVAAHGAALSQLGQDVWITKSPATDYLLTRRWASRILGWTPGAAGIGYRCRHDEDLEAWMLTSTPETLEHPALRPEGRSLNLDSPQGRAFLRPVLALYNAALSSATVPT